MPRAGQLGAVLSCPIYAVSSVQLHDAVEAGEVHERINIFINELYSLIYIR